jgi:hypothetical protein
MLLVNTMIFKMKKLLFLNNKVLTNCNINNIIKYKLYSMIIVKFFIKFPNILTTNTIKS